MNIIKKVEQFFNFDQDTNVDEKYNNSNSVETINFDNNTLNATDLYPHSDGFRNGASYHQWQQNDYNCGMTSVMTAANMLLNDNVYVNNEQEWIDMGSNSETVVTDGGQFINTWLSKKGLTDSIELATAYDWQDPDSGIQTTEELVYYLTRGGVCIMSANGPVFKTSDPNAGPLTYDHVVTFYFGDDRRFYCNDSELGAAIPYTRSDLELFMQYKIGSAVLMPKDNATVQSKLNAADLNTTDFNPLNMKYNNSLKLKQLPIFFDGSNIKYINELKSSTNAKFAIDVSENNPANIDWNAVKSAGIDRAIVRANVRYYGSGKLLEDANARQNVMNAIDAGLDVQLYSFSCPLNEYEAKQEAEGVVNFIKSLPQEYQSKLNGPIVCDHEVFDTFDNEPTRLAGQTYDQHTNNIQAFNDYLNDRGYKTMTYSSRSFFQSQFDGQAITNENNYAWIAEQDQNITYDGDYHMWQYTDKGYVLGVDGQVDLNVYYEK